MGLPADRGPRPVTVRSIELDDPHVVVTEERVRGFPARAPSISGHRRREA
jgi:hypothetical protein